MSKISEETSGRLWDCLYFSIVLEKHPVGFLDTNLHANNEESNATSNYFLDTRFNMPVGSTDPDRPDLRGHFRSFTTNPKYLNKALYKSERATQ